MKNNSMNLISILIPLTLACSLIPSFRNLTLAPKATTPPEILHFDNEFVAFDYPSTLQIFSIDDPGFITYPIGNELGGQLVTGLADPGEIIPGDLLVRTISIFRYSINTDMTLNQLMENSYQSVRHDDANYKLNSPSTVAGLTATQKTYRAYDGVPYEMRDI